MYNVGAVTFSQAVSQCEKDRSIVMNSIRLKDRNYLKDLTSFRDVDGTIKQALVWINPAVCIILPNQDSCPSCSVYNAKHRGQVQSRNSCSELHPFICKKLSIELCKNGCFQQGTCVGKTCVCKKGWESDDCSKFHCRDVSNCLGRGDCVGPNVCKCRPGWVGRTCSNSYCHRFKSCPFCSRQKGCGWCDKEAKCLPGTGHGPDVSLQTPCTSWFYYQCLTVEGSIDCSDQIAVMPCAGRYCNNNATEKNSGLCQQCKDVQNCYDSSLSCQTWNETKCPKGRPVTNYDDPSRIEATQFKPNVHVIHNNQTMFVCPYIIEKNSKDTLYISLGNGLKVGRIMLAGQCGGIMHRVTSVTEVNEYQFVVAYPVGLEDVISYADFQQTVNTDSVQDEITLEDVPDIKLISDILEAKENLNETIHEINETVYKCIGHQYSSDNEDDLTMTHYTVLKQSSFTDNINVGDIVTSKRSGGFLENIISHKTIEIGTVAHTELSRCDMDSVRKMSFNLNMNRRDMACQGGDNWPGFLYWDSKDTNDINGTVVGRKSGPVLGKVMDKFTLKGFTFFEILQVSSYIDGDLHMKGNITQVQTHLRSRRSLKNLFHRIETKLDVSFSFCYSKKSRYSHMRRIT